MDAYRQPQLIGDYEILNVLGRGGMGIKAANITGKKLLPGI